MRHRWRHLDPCRPPRRWLRLCGSFFARGRCVCCYGLAHADGHKPSRDNIKVKLSRAHGRRGVRPRDGGRSMLAQVALGCRRADAVTFTGSWRRRLAASLARPMTGGCGWPEQHMHTHTHTHTHTCNARRTRRRCDEEEPLRQQVAADVRTVSHSGMHS